MPLWRKVRYARCDRPENTVDGSAAIRFSRMLLCLFEGVSARVFSIKSSLLTYIQWMLTRGANVLAWIAVIELPSSALGDK